MNIKWYTVTQYVDLQTGEVIDKSTYEREYVRIRSSKKTEITEKIIRNERVKQGFIKWTIECREHKQFRIF